ncbi:MAG: molybdopterin converting factor subunit 1 [Planctomycetes bacterium]|nr:molybdopterin converting factor subunit 1 [Planctomycetota bacterium]MCP4839836.1 molybdopterin converting factor subunit 1 [Planctomycetota bacterium]
MTITVQYFAILADRIGTREESYDAAQGRTVAALLDEASRRHAAVAEMKDSVAVAVNNTYAQTTQIIEPGDTVALIPPVSGG